MAEGTRSNVDTLERQEDLKGFPIIPQDEKWKERFIQPYLIRTWSFLKPLWLKFQLLMILINILLNPLLPLSLCKIHFLLMVNCSIPYAISAQVYHSEIEMLCGPVKNKLCLNLKNVTQFDFESAKVLLLDQ